MKQIKFLLAAVLALCLMLSLCACGGNGDNNTTTGNTTAAAAGSDGTSEATSAPEDDGKVLYRVTVVDQDGNPISGAMVQLCLDTCFPSATNESGVAEFRTVEADYKVSMMMMPDGYTYSTEEQEFHFAAGSTELTITLKAEA